MILNIVGIVLGIIAIGLFIWSRKDQDLTNDLIDSDVKAIENSYRALMEDFTNYQVDTNRKLSHIEKQLEIKSKENERKIIKLTEALPKVIRNVVGHIEFAKPLDKK